MLLSPRQPPSLLLLLLVLVVAARTGSGIRCYSTLCSSVTNDTHRCAFRREEARLVSCHYDELLETRVRVEVGELTPTQSLRGIRDQDMQCVHVQSTAVWSSGIRKVDFRACMPPDRLRCEILHNSTIRKYEAIHGPHGVRIYWGCAMCDTDGCNSGSVPGQSGATSPRAGGLCLPLLALLASALPLRILVPC